MAQHKRAGGTSLSMCLVRTASKSEVQLPLRSGRALNFPTSQTLVQLPLVDSGVVFKSGCKYLGRYRK